MHNFTTLGDINNSHSQSPRHNAINASSFLNGSILAGHNSHNIIGSNTLHYADNSRIGLLSGDNFSKTFMRNTSNLRTVQPGNETIITDHLNTTFEKDW